MICRQCGCDKPCPCDGYTTSNTCERCGCAKPCACDGYSMGCDHTDAPLSYYQYDRSEEEQ